MSDEVLGMTAIPEDREADAAILFDKSTIAITLRVAEHLPPRCGDSF